MWVIKLIRLNEIRIFYFTNKARAVVMYIIYSSAFCSKGWGFDTLPGSRCNIDLLIYIEVCIIYKYEHK